MRKKFRPRYDQEGIEEPLINLTPLIDVVFVVLIVFMLISPVLNIDLVDLAPGGGSSAQASGISLSVHADNSIWFQGERLTLVQLEKRLREEKKRHPQMIPQIAHDSRAQFGTYQSVKNLLQTIGFEQMDVILKPN